MLKIRRPLGRLIFNMGIAIPGKTVFLIETAPWLFVVACSVPSITWTIDSLSIGPPTTKPWQNLKEYTFIKKNAFEMFDVYQLVNHCLHVNEIGRCVIQENDNYRPVSVLSSLSKFLWESWVNDSLIFFRWNLICSVASFHEELQLLVIPLEYNRLFSKIAR